MPGETSSLPDDTTFLRHHIRHISTDQPVRNWFLAVSIELIRIGHLPGPARGAIVITHSGAHRLHFRLLGVECVSITILLATDIAIALYSVDLEDRVVLSVNLWVWFQVRI
jgi:hypothetical protein